MKVLMNKLIKDIKEKLKKERIKLTDARALMLYVLYDLIKQGEFVSEFSAEKVCYFLQKFGAEKYFKLKYQPNFYGPYSGKVRFVLNFLSGSYILGYSDLNKRPFEPLLLVQDGDEEVRNYIESKPELKAIAQKTVKFLDGFYSDFSLELLSTVDWIMNKKNTNDIDVIKQELNKCNCEKRTKIFNDKHIEIVVNHLKNINLKYKDLNIL